MRCYYTSIMYADIWQREEVTFLKFKDIFAWSQDSCLKHLHESEEERSMCFNSTI